MSKPADSLLPAFLVALLCASWLPASARDLEQITVTARHTRTAWDTATSPLGRGLAPADSAAPVASIAELARQQPGISYAGQGGLLQTISIRGISGQRVANFWGELPVLSERRAGTSSSFIDPLMLKSVEVLRGPASTYYGNGASAGVLQMTPARPTATEWQLQRASAGDESLQYLGFGGDQASLALSRRVAEDTESANGDPLHTEFEQYNAQLLWDFELAGKPIELQQLVSEGRDIGKSNVQFPDQRITDYPRERHWLGQLSTTITEDFRGSIFYHYQELDTRVERPQTRLNEVASESLDWGLRLESGWLGQAFPLRVSVDYLGRRGVDSTETETDLDSGERRREQTLDAEQDSLDISVDGFRQLHDLAIAAGIRWAYIDQSASARQGVDDSAFSGFIRANWELAASFELSLELASGVRFAGLSERYFSGTTGRGTVLGNPGLDPEDTVGLDLGLHWRGRYLEIEAHAYGTRIDDYIERVDLSEDLRSFRNLTEGEILGVEAAAVIPLGSAWELGLGGHYLDGEDDEGTTLADLTPATVYGTLRYAREHWRGDLQFSYRFSESQVAPGESPVDSAALLSAGLSRSWPNGLQLRLWGRNLLDQGWRLSTDSLATEGPERALGVTLSWHQSPR